MRTIEQLKKDYETEDLREVIDMIRVEISCLEDGLFDTHLFDEIRLVEDFLMGERIFKHF